MGILDDAIREHLELKRKHGAPGDDVERLEKEAFGPSKRPDDEESEGADEEAAASADAEATEPAAGEEGDSSPFGPDLTVDWDGDGEDAGGAEAEGVAYEPDSEEMSPAERARIDYAELDDTADHPAVDSPETGEQGAAAAEPVEPAESAIFDAEDDEGGEDDLGDIDLDLDVEDEPAPSRDAPPSAEEAPTELQPEQPDDDELEIDFELDDLGDEVESTEPGTAERAAPGPSPEAEDGEQSFEDDDAAEDDLEDEDEDLLEETPDFLQDAPEGERLWFEQGEPKDFDFDD